MKKYLIIFIFIFLFGIGAPTLSASACSFVLNPDFESKTIYLEPVVRTTGLPGDVPAKGYYLKISDTGGTGADCGPFQTHVSIVWAVFLLTTMFFVMRKFFIKK